MTTNPPKQPKKKRGRPPKFGKRRNFNFRLSEEARGRLVDSAHKEKRSLSEELEFRVNRDLNWEAAQGDIDQMKARAAAWENAAMINAIRAAGLAILREIDARPVRVIIDLETLLAETDGIARGLRGGFIDAKSPEPSNEIRSRTADEERRLIEKERQLLEELERTRRELHDAIERTLAADAAAKKAKRSA
jgi:hypothetical protein